MLKFADLVEQHSEELALLETIAIGKPVSLILGFDLPHMIGCYRCKKQIPNFASMATRE
jgi:acyl-CoA reductase-like NAD-dependent aldehyde dehydrogenase